MVCLELRKVKVNPQFISKILVLIASMLLSFGVTACGGGSSTRFTGLAGRWVATETVSGVSYQHVLKITGSESDFRAEHYLAYSGYEQFIRSYPGRREGNTVLMTYVGSYILEGQLSGNRLSFGDFPTNLGGSITFQKR